MSIDSSKFLTQFIKDVKPSGIRKFFDIAAERKDIISLSVGEPDFTTPLVVRQAAIRSIEEGDTHYTANYGVLELRRRIAEYLKDRFYLEYDPQTEIVITVGGSEAVDIVFRAICERGDEVLLPQPAFVSYEPCIALTGGIPVSVPTTMEEGFKVTPEKLAKYITPKTKAIVLNFPCNPTGVTVNKQELQAIADFCIKHDLLVISDEIYAELTYGGEHVSIASLPGMYERTIVVSGFSKAFAMTGWRIGYLCGPRALVDGIAKVHQFALMCSPVTAQMGAIAGFTPEGEKAVRVMLEEYDRRRKLIVGRFKNMGLAICEPQGAFYAFPSIKSTGLSSEQFCNGLVDDYGVACVPGNAFSEYGEGFIRCSYANSYENVMEACNRIERFINSLK